MKPVVGFEGIYLVSEEGIIYSLRSRWGLRKQPKPLRPANDSKGYPTVILCHNKTRTTCRVHSIVATAYLHKGEDMDQVNHKDGDKTNNRVSNLEWSDASANGKHAWDTGLRDKEVHSESLKKAWVLRRNRYA